MGEARTEELDAALRSCLGKKRKFVLLLVDGEAAEVVRHAEVGEAVAGLLNAVAMLVDDLAEHYARRHDETERLLRERTERIEELERDLTEARRGGGR